MAGRQVRRTAKVMREVRGEILDIAHLLDSIDGLIAEVSEQLAGLESPYPDYDPFATMRELAAALDDEVGRQVARYYERSTSQDYLSNIATSRTIKADESD